MATRPLFLSWEQFYFDAILETDDKRMRERIETAEEAISMRLVGLTQKKSDLAEVLEIENALKGLHTLRRERLSAP